MAMPFTASALLIEDLKSSHQKPKKRGGGKTRFLKKMALGGFSVGPGQEPFFLEHAKDGKAGEEP